MTVRRRFRFVSISPFTVRSHQRRLPTRHRHVYLEIELANNVVCLSGHRHSSPQQRHAAFVFSHHGWGDGQRRAPFVLQLNNPVWRLRGTGQASEGCRHQVEFRLELRNPSELHAQLSFRGGETLFDSPDRCRRRPDDAGARRGWCGRRHYSFRGHCEHLRFSRAYARAEEDRCTELNTRSRTEARVADVRLGTALLRPLWYAAGNAERSVTVTTSAEEARRGVEECVHIRASAKVQT